VETPYLGKLKIKCDNNAYFSSQKYRKTTYKMAVIKAHFLRSYFMGQPGQNSLGQNPPARAQIG